MNSLDHPLLTVIIPCRELNSFTVFFLQAEQNQMNDERKIHNTNIDLSVCTVSLGNYYVMDGDGENAMGAFS